MGTKFRVAGKTIIEIDNKAGTVTDLSAYVDTISGLGRQFASLDVTAFSDSAERIIAGIEESVEFTISGHYDNTTTTGPDAVLAPLVGTLGSFTFAPAGSTAPNRKISGESLCMRYTPSAEVKGRVEFEAVFKVDGAVTLGTY